MRLQFAVSALLFACSGAVTGGSGGGSTAGGDATAGGGAATGGGDATGGGVANGGGAATGGGSAGANGGGTSSGVPLFVASGHMGRTIVSCDDGRTWVGDRSDDDAMRCFVANGNPDGGSSDCDHNPSAGHGVVYSNGWFIASYGWGFPGSIRRSRDGVSWQRTLDGFTFQNLVVGGGAVLASSRSPRVSSDDGLGWDAGATADLRGDGGAAVYNVRAAGFGNGAFAMFGNDGANRDLMVSTDRAATWRRPTQWPLECGNTGALGFAYGNGALLMIDRGGNACRSTDDGVTFTRAAIGGDVATGPQFANGQFVAWGRRSAPMYTPVMFSSPDGVTWTLTDTRRRLTDGGTAAGGGPDIGPAARSTAGTWVAIRGGWMTWYAAQEFYRSTDGLTWDVLPQGSFTGSHPMAEIAFGLGDKPAACP